MIVQLLLNNHKNVNIPLVRVQAGPRMAGSKKRSRKGTDSKALELRSVDQIKALSNPLRLRMLEQFSEAPATPKQVAERLGCKPTRVYHHVATLERAGLIQQVDSKQVRGTVEKYYSAVAKKMSIDRTAFGPAAEEILSSATELGVLDSLFQSIRDEYAKHIDERSDNSENEIPAFFVRTKIRASDTAAAALQQRIENFIDELKAEAESLDDEDKKPHRLIIGWYPAAE